MTSRRAVSLVAAVCATAVAALLLSSASQRLVSQPASFYIPEDATRPRPLLRRLLFWSGLARAGEHEMVMQVRLKDLEDGHTLKLWGFSYITAQALWSLSAERVERYGGQEWLNIAHEHSDRFVGSVTAKGGEPPVLHIRPYVYRNAVGGITPRDEVPRWYPSVSGALIAARDGERIAMHLSYRAEGVVFAARSLDRPGVRGEAFVPYAKAPRPAWLWKHFAHDDNGGRPADDGAVAFAAEVP